MKEFENRLRKNYKHIGKWAKRQGISCFRLYDSDVPSFPFCIDIYGEYVHVSEYKTKYKMDEEHYDPWIQGCISVICEVLQTDKEKVFLKLRERQKGVKQYEKFSDNSIGVWVEELGSKFWLNLTDYLDTGLFLDHRNTRMMVRTISEGKKVLNLFSYTGAFSVHAAIGGAAQVDTVDMSQTYLSWAEKNMKANGFTDKNKYRYFREDILDWLPGNLINFYDIIILDPPSFSNSKKMIGFLDIQQDHVWMILKCMKALKKDGVLIFSTNLRNFNLDETLSNKLIIKDISKQSVPNDFRNKKIHQCYKISSKF